MSGFRRWLCVALAFSIGLFAFALWRHVAGDTEPGTPAVILVALTMGVNFTVWGCVGGLRWLDETLPPLTARWGFRRRTRGRHARAGDGRASASPDRPVTRADVAVLIPGYNEELVIRDSIASATRLLPRANIHVVSDGSTDATADIALKAGVNVLDLVHNRGKAGALEAAITHFQLTERYHAVLFLDADSELDADYLAGALRFLADPEIAAVAGYATTMWEPERLSLVGQLIVAYRDRLYTVQQRFYKFGQTWRRLSVTYIVPGFASVYRSRAIRQMNLNPPGLIIEDFNMTFQLHRRKLGRIGFSPRVRAAAQDPNNLGDYVRQVRRWSLGFWQTIRCNGVWPSLFWLTLGLIIAESLVAAVAFLGAIVLAAGLALPLLTDGSVLAWGSYKAAYAALNGYITLPMLALAVLVPDYLLTCVLAAVRRRPRYFLLGLGFPLLRLIDAVLALWAIPLAWTARSTGAWRSPTRR